MFRLLSHVLSPKYPGWPGEPTLQVQTHSLISEGSHADTYVIHLFNHFGTHIDGPKHFTEKGKRIADFPIESFIFNKPLLIDIPKGFGEFLTWEELEPFRGRILEADLLLIRSGVNPYKFSRPEEFTSNGPALHSEAAKSIMDTFPNLKAIGVDWFSIASPAHLPDGYYTHHYLLGRYHDHHVFIIEDMNLEGLKAEDLRRIFVAPLFVEGIDSSPVTIIADLADSRT